MGVFESFWASDGCRETIACASGVFLEIVVRVSRRFVDIIVWASGELLEIVAWATCNLLEIIVRTSGGFSKFVDGPISGFGENCVRTSG